jgi:hypothetical protein
MLSACAAQKLRVRYLKGALVAWNDADGHLKAKGISESKPIWGITLEKPEHWGIGGIVAAGGDAGVAWKSAPRWPPVMQ